MPARTQPETAPAPESTAAPAERPVQDPVTTPPTRKQAAPVDPAPFPEERIDIPAALPQAAAQDLPPYLLPLSAAGIVLGGLAVLIGMTVYLQLRRSHRELFRQIRETQTQLTALDLDQALSSGQLPPSSWHTTTAVPAIPPRNQPITDKQPIPISNPSPNPVNPKHTPEASKPGSEEEITTRNLKLALESHFTEYSRLSGAK